MKNDNDYAMEIALMAVRQLFIELGFDDPINENSSWKLYDCYCRIEELLKESKENSITEGEF